MVVKVFTTSGANFREAWVACPANYTAISASAYRAGVATIFFRWEPGTMTGVDAQSGTAGGGPPGGTTFAASNERRDGRDRAKRLPRLDEWQRRQHAHRPHLHPRLTDVRVEDVRL